MKLAHKNVPYFAGNMASKVCPNIREYLHKPKLIIAVTGTNGKSTICKMLVDFFNSQNMRVVNNDGFNTAPGIIANLVDCVTIFNRCIADVVVLEVDEVSSKSIFKGFEPDYMIINNLMRDSIRSNSTPDYVKDRINDAISKKMKLIINADDAMTVTLDNGNAVFFGMSKLSSDHEGIYNLVNDAVLCPKCTKRLKYNFVKYNNIGDYECTCGFKRPIRKYEISKIDFKKNNFLLNGFKYDLNLNNVANTYNALAVISLLSELGYSNEIINESLKDVKILDTRYFTVNENNKTLTGMMIKGSNPNTMLPMLNIVTACKKKKDIVFVFDDLQRRKYEVETEHWIYDVDFEMLSQDKHINKIIVGGPRSKDYLVRLMLAGIDKRKIVIVNEEHKVIDQISYSDVNSIFLAYDIYSCDLAFELRDAIKARMAA